MDETTNRDPSDLQQGLIVQTLIGLMTVLVLIMVLGAFFRAPLQRIAFIAVESFGLPGLFIGVIASDAVSFPVPPSAYFIITVAAEANPVAIVSVTSVASLIGGSIAYYLGPLGTRMPLLRRRFEAFQSRGEEFFEKWGLWTVGIAAISPIPFAFACWLAGIYRVPFWKFFAVMLLRIPRFVVYYAFFLFGWTTATGW